MKINLLKFDVSLKKPRASALLIALLLMTFLVIVGLGMSRIVIDAIRVEKNVIEAGKAYFAAEGGIELALYQRETHLPGYEVQNDSSVTPTWTYANEATVDYAMVAAETQQPCSHRDSESRRLEVQESVLWPLYRWDAEDGYVNIDHFTLSYEVDRSDGAYIGVEGEVLRWKILGIDDETSGDAHTEAISGLLQYDAGHVTLTSDEGANFYDGSSGGTFVNYEAYPISTFLGNHTFNTLILTNIIDLSVQSADENGIELQLSTEAVFTGQEEGTACEYTLLQADGRSGESVQNIDVQIKLDSFLPVFNFVLYNTDSDSEESSGSGWSIDGLDFDFFDLNWILN